MARNKRARIDTHGPVEGLGHNPFAALGGGDGAESGPAAGTGTPAPQDPAPSPPRVSKTRKGGWPLSLEKRPGGKVMTILRQVEGDGERLLKALRKYCGAGGVVREDRIELQGDHQETIKDWLDKGMPGLKD